MLKRIIGGLDDPDDDLNDPEGPGFGDDPENPAPPPDPDPGDGIEDIQIYPDNPYANQIAGESVVKTTFADGRVLLETPGASVWLHA